MDHDDDRSLSSSPSQSAGGLSPAGSGPRLRGPRPLPPGVPYHRVLAGEKRRIGRGIAALVLLLGGLFVAAAVFGLLGSFVDTMLGRRSPGAGGSEFTPVFHAGFVIPIAVLMPWSMLVQRWLYGVRGASLHSVSSLFRFDMFGRSLMVIVPIWTIYMTVYTVLSPYPEGPWRLGDLLGVFAVTVLLVPLQSAGEEYGLRGLTFRIAASWSRRPRTALIIGVVVSSLLFTVIHLSTDPWLNLYYFTFGVTLALITWRTGGLEIAIVIHAANNTLAFLVSLVAHSDLVAGIDRSAGAGSVTVLVPCVLLIAITVVVWLRTRRTGAVLTPSDPQSR